MGKSRKEITQDYARNAIVDGNTSAGRYERSMAIKEASGQGPSMRSPLKGVGGMSNHRNFAPEGTWAEHKAASHSEKKKAPMTDLERRQAKSVLKGESEELRKRREAGAGAPTKNLESAGGGLVSSTEAKPYMTDEGGPYMMGGGSWMSKHSQSKMSPLGNYDTANGSHGHPHSDAPLKVENVIDRDAKSSGPDQYNKFGK